MHMFHSKCYILQFLQVTAAEWPRTQCN